MKFTLSTIKRLYLQADRGKGLDIKELEKIGFIFKPVSQDKIHSLFSDAKYFTIQNYPEIEIKSLEELIQFSNKFGEIIVEDGSIEIYNDYGE